MTGWTHLGRPDPETWIRLVAARGRDVEVMQKPVAARLLPSVFLQAIGQGERSLLLPETTVEGPDGARIPVRLSGTVLRMGGYVGGAAFLQDLREIKQLERQNLHNERMAAVGHTVAQLARKACRRDQADPGGGAGSRGLKTQGGVARSPSHL